jgi:uncharacterized protein YcfL
MRNCKTLLILLSALLLSACSSNEFDESATEQSPSALYESATLTVELTEYQIYKCAQSLVGSSFCDFFGYVSNNGSSPLDFLAEMWGEDSQGNSYKGIGTFEASINPGLRERVDFSFQLPKDIVLETVHLVDISGPTSDVILSALVNVGT